MTYVGEPEEVEVQATLATNDLFTLAPTVNCTTCTTLENVFLLAFDTTATVNIEAQPVSQSASTQNHALTDVLTLTFVGASPYSGPLSVQYVYLQVTPSGAVLSLAPSPVSMQPTKAGVASTVGGSFYVVNSGNMSTSGLGLTLTDSTDFSVSSGGAGTFSVAAARYSAMAASFDPATTGAKSTSATLTDTNGVVGLCQSALPAAITLTGSGQ